MDNQKTTNKLIEVLLEKADKHDERLTDIEKILVVQEANLRHHIKRTDLAEENLEMLREQLKPIEKHVAMVDGSLKMVGGAGIVIGIIVGIIEIINFLHLL